MKKLNILLIRFIGIFIFGVCCSISYATNYYASPQGVEGGDGRNKTTPFQVKDFWGKAKPGDTLYLLDGVYTHPNMINPSSGDDNLNGKEGSPITIKALHDGKVEFDGENKYAPIWLRNKKWFVIEGVNAHHSLGNVVELKKGSEHNIIRRVCGWDASNGNDYIFYVTADGDAESRYNLFEDCAGWGLARKIYANSVGGNYNTWRRCWGRWEGSHLVGPKMTYSTVYKSYHNIYDNCIGTWDAQCMKETYTLLDYDGKPWAGSGAGTYKNYTVDQPYGIFGMDRNWPDKRANVKFFGCIAYTTSDQRIGAFEGGFFITKLSNMELYDCVSCIDKDHNLTPFYLSSIKTWQPQVNCNNKDNESFSSVIPTSKNGYFYDCVVSGVSGKSEPSWKVKENATNSDNTVTWKNAGPLLLKIKNSTGIGKKDSYIHDSWSQKNVLLGRSIESTYGQGKSIYNSLKGANIYYCYENGVLTNKPLWPWPMEQRIYEATTRSGHKPVSVTGTIEKLFGPIKSRNTR